jgi:SagB-type dehydrogenase family enzyme
MGFIDQQVNGLIDVDPMKEVAFSLVALGNTKTAPPGAPPLKAMNLPLVPCSREEVDYPAMRQMHEASSLVSSDEVAKWRQATLTLSLPAVKGALFDAQPPAGSTLPADTIEQVIQRRGSTRKFSHESISLAELSTILDRATRGISADILAPFGTQLNDLYLIVNNVRDLAPGAYYFHRNKQQLELLKEGDFRQQARYLGLEQELPADASVDIFFLADLPRILTAFGNRGYRATQLEAGIVGGKLYLTAYTLKLGATGLTFYDDDVVNFFSPHARGKNAIFLVCCGRAAKT